jgi:hypothetical protein
MGCGCNKNRFATGARIAATAPASGRTPASAARPPVKTKVRSTAHQMPEADSPRPFNRMRYYVKAPDGTEEVYNTLAEAQAILRRHGGPRSGYVVESRRDSS